MFFFDIPHPNPCQLHNSLRGGSGGRKIAAPTTSAAISDLGHLPQLRTVYYYFVSNTSGIPSHSFIPDQLFAFAGTSVKGFDQFSHSSHGDDESCFCG